MKSLSSFIGKCLTVLIGIALSWATVTRPEVDSLAAQLCGGARRDAAQDTHQGIEAVPSQIAPSHHCDVWQQDSATKSNASSNSTQQRFTNEGQIDPIQGAVAESPSDATGGSRILEISQRLKQLGASYLLLERLPQENGAKYRVRCDLADQQKSVKCCFEATSGTAQAAMEEVLRAARKNASPRDVSLSAVATSR